MKLRLKTVKYTLSLLSIIMLCSFIVLSQEMPEVHPAGPSYKVKKLKGNMKIDADWNKAQWRNIKPLNITNLMGKAPSFIPAAQAKMMYDEKNLYVIFRVNERFIKVVTDKINGPVWRDSAVEFFFSPDATEPLKYFNLETNGGGTPLLGYNGDRRIQVDEMDIRKIEIAHTLPKLVDPEMTEPREWVIEYRIPVLMLEAYSKITRPAKGVEWRANFYKIAENTSNIHFLTWSVVKNDKPNFHLPRFFGTLKFM
ncbi:MAG: carbohydrate-binding family 9-like protein [Daejeonella sp.]